MESYTEIEFRKNMDPIFRAIFTGGSAYDAPFQPGIQPRLLLYGFHWYLHEPWLEPVVRTLKELGEEGFYVSALYRPKPEEQTQPYHWFVPLSEAASYGAVVVSQENAIYSVNSQWGIICSDEDHALVGGSELLVENIKNAVGDLDYRLSEFFKAWKDYHRRNKVDITWIPPMLSHVYGPEKAAQLLRQAQLDWLLHGEE